MKSAVLCLSGKIGMIAAVVFATVGSRQPRRCSKSAAGTPSWDWMRRRVRPCGLRMPERDWNWPAEAKSCFVWS